MESSQAALELSVRSPRPTYEAHGSRPGAVFAHGCFLGVGNRCPQRQTQIAVRVHPQKRPITIALEEITWSASVAGREDFHDRGFGPLEATGAFELRKLRC